MSKRPFHILSIEGLPKSGKTALALKAPGPIGVQSLDFGLDRAMSESERDDLIIKEYDLAYDFTIKSRGEDAEEQSKTVRKDYWAPFEKDAHELFESCRTVIWDTATEVWEMLRLAHFGKLVQNPQLQYGPINAEYKALIRLAHRFRTNLVLIHHQSKLYQNKMVNDKLESIDTGKWKRAGNNKIEALVDSYVEQTYEEPTYDKKGELKDPGVFKTRILRAGYAPANNGMTLESPDWDTLMAFLHPSVEDWNA